MSQVQQHLHLIGYRPDRIAEQVNDVTALQSLFDEHVPESIVDFLVRLSDCVLYYRFDATTNTGRQKTYSHFVTTNIGSGPKESPYCPFPVSIVGRIHRFRRLGMPR